MWCSSARCISARCWLISTSISARIDGAFSRRAWLVLSLAFSSPMSTHIPVFESLDRNRPDGLDDRISFTMLLAISRFSLLNRAVTYTRFRFSTNSRNRSLPGLELIEPPRPHSTSLLCGSFTWARASLLSPPSMAWEVVLTGPSGVTTGAPPFPAVPFMLVAPADFSGVVVAALFMLTPMTLLAAVVGPVPVLLCSGLESSR